MTRPSVPTKNFSCTVPSSSKRLEALGYSGFSQLEALITAATLTGGAGGGGGGAMATGSGEGGAMGVEVLGVVGLELGLDHIEGRDAGGRTHRSTSPKTMSREPRMAETSASMCPLQSQSMAERWAKPGARILQR